MGLYCQYWPLAATHTDTHSPSPSLSTTHNRVEVELNSTRCLSKVRWAHQLKPRWASMRNFVKYALPKDWILRETCSLLTWHWNIRRPSASPCPPRPVGGLITWLEPRPTQQQQYDKYDIPGPVSSGRLLIGQLSAVKVSHWLPPSFIATQSTLDTPPCHCLPMTSVRWLGLCDLNTATHSSHSELMEYLCH